MKNAIYAAMGTALTVALAILGLSAASATGGGDDHKTSICHRTASDTNPYVFETVDNASLQAHLSNGKGHFPKEWKSDGTWRGVPHVAGDPKNDYLATAASDCQDTTQTPPSDDQPTVVEPNLPTRTDSDCDTDGSMVIPEQPEHVTVDPAPGTYGPGDYTVTFTASPNDGDNDGDDYVFENGTDTMTVQVHVAKAGGNGGGECSTPTPTPTPTPNPPAPNPPTPNPPHHQPHNPPNHNAPPSPQAPPVGVDGGL
jgi:hypothetical protein